MVSQPVPLRSVVERRHRLMRGWMSCGYEARDCRGVDKLKFVRIDGENIAMGARIVACRPLGVLIRPGSSDDVERNAEVGKLIVNPGIGTSRISANRPHKAGHPIVGTVHDNEFVDVRQHQLCARPQQFPVFIERQGTRSNSPSTAASGPDGRWMYQAQLTDATVARSFVIRHTLRA